MPVRHHASGRSELVVLSRAVRGAVAGGAIGRRVVGRRGGKRLSVQVAALGTARRAGGGAERHVFHAFAYAAHLELAQPVLEELEVPPALAHLGVELGENGLIAGLLPHDTGGLDQGLLAFDFFVDIEQLVFVRHDCGVGSLRAEAHRKETLGEIAEDFRQGPLAWLPSCIFTFLWGGGVLPGEEKCRIESNKMNARRKPPKDCLFSEWKGEKKNS